MTGIVLYANGANLALLFCYALYVLFLRKETFFNLNRFFLLGSVLFSLIIPLIQFETPEIIDSKLTSSIERSAISGQEYIAYVTEWPEDLPMKLQVSDSQSIGWRQVVIWVLGLTFIGGVVYHLVTFIMSSISLIRLKGQSKITEMEDMKLVEVNRPIPSFSFLNYAFIYSEDLRSEEFDKILAHERTHIRQRHTYDLLFVQLTAILFWFNPIIWRLIKSIKANHEYIVDRTIINQGYSLVEYQSLLLSQLVSSRSFELAHNFNLSFIKKRITMMTKTNSSLSAKLRAGMIFPAMILFSMVFVRCNEAIEEAKVIMNFQDVPMAADISGELIVASEYQIRLTSEGPTVNGKPMTEERMTDIASKTDGHEIFKIHLAGDITMNRVDEVFDLLAQVDRRKVVMVSPDNKSQFKMLLPPHENHLGDRPKMPARKELEEILNVHPIGVDSYKLDQLRAEVTKTIRDEGSGGNKFVFSIEYHDETPSQRFFDAYLEAQLAFDDYYDERANELFGRGFGELDPEEVKQARKGVPRSVGYWNMDHL